MGLTSITIENFKGIGAPVTIPLRPITLLFGANSAGKSTIIQALQYAWEVLENKNADVHRTTLGDEAIDLGGFRNLVHKHDLSRTIKISLDYRGGLLNTKYYPEFEFLSCHLDHLSNPSTIDVTNWFAVEQLSVRIETAWNADSDAPYVALYEVAINSEVFGWISAQKESVRLGVDSSHPFFSESPSVLTVDGFFDEDSYELWSKLTTSLINDFPFEEFKKDVECLDKESAQKPPKELKRVLDLKGESIQEPVEHPWELDQTSVIPEWGRVLYPNNNSDEEKSWVLSQFLCGAGESVLSELRGLRYLGPLRKVPDRSYLELKRPRESPWANGLAAWDSLLNADKSDDGRVLIEDDGLIKRYEFNDLWRGKIPLIEKCNQYIGNKLGLHYELRREDIIQLPSDGNLMTTLRKLADQSGSFSSDDIRHAVSEIESESRLKILKIRDTKNGVDVAPADIGTGVPQIVPVVVGAVDPNCRIFSVEEPELHVHPAVQVNLADVFLQEALGEPGRAFLLETHSEHIALRIMRRMRETCQGKLPPNFPPVKPKHVAILYVDTFEDRTVIREMPLNELGELVKSWPGGFFEESLREVL